MKPQINDGMKAKFMGEFSFEIEEPCPLCELHINEHYDDIPCLCDGEGKYMRSVTVPWDTCKEIYQAMASFSEIPSSEDRRNYIRYIAGKAKETALRKYPYDEDKS